MLGVDDEDSPRVSAGGLPPRPSPLAPHFALTEETARFPRLASSLTQRRSLVTPRLRTRPSRSICFGGKVTKPSCFLGGIHLSGPPPGAGAARNGSRACGEAGGRPRSARRAHFPQPARRERPAAPPRPQVRRDHVTSPRLRATGRTAPPAPAAGKHHAPYDSARLRACRERPPSRAPRARGPIALLPGP